MDSEFKEKNNKNQYLSQEIVPITAFHFVGIISTIIKAYSFYYFNNMQKS